MTSCAYSHEPADCTPLFFTRLLLLAFALATIGLGRALAQCPILAPGPTWNVDGCTFTPSTSGTASGISIGVNAPGDLDVTSNVTLTVSNTVWDGFSAAGTLNISNAGVVNDAYGNFGGVSGVAGTATVSGSGSQWNNSSDLSVGLNGQGTLTISSGGHVSDAQGYIGANGGSGGTATVSGSGSRWNNSNALDVGLDGQGTLTVSNGGVVDASVQAGIGNGTGGSDTIAVTGPGSELNTGLLDVGSNGQGSLDINIGGVVSSSYVSVGVNSGSTGTVSVSGTGSELTAKFFGVGSNGSGSLDIENAGVATETIGATLGQNAGSVGTVIISGPGSQLNSGDEGLIVGGLGEGTLRVEGGGVFAESSDRASDGAYIGWGKGSVGAVTVTDPGSQWKVTGTGILYVGYAGTGSLTVANGGLVADQAASVGNNAVFPQMASANGQGPGSVVVSGPGSTWSNVTTLDIGNGGKGTLTVSNGGLVSAQTITIDTQGTVNAKGGTLQGTVINHGTLDPLGAITINGDYTQGVDGTLILDVAGKGAGDFGQLDVSGNGTFGGTIDFNFINGFAPSKGDSFDFINVGGSADFSGATIDFGGLLPGFDYSDSFQNGQFILTALNDGVASSPTPEPSAILLFGTALLGLAAYYRLRRRGQLALQ